MQYSVLVLAAFAAAGMVSGCGQSAAAPGPASAGPSPASSSPASGAVPEGDAVLGELDGVPIRASELDPESQARVSDLRNELGQRLVHTLWVGVEREVDRRLLAKEAERQGLSPEELRAREIEGKVEAPSQEEVAAFYERFADRIGLDLEKAAPLIERQLKEQRIEEAEAAYLAGLRDGALVRYSLPMPELPRVAVDVGSAPSRGPEDAPVTVVEFSDFECPYCSKARSVLDELVQLYPETVRLVYRDFPLDQHPRARPAAEAAQCAHEQDKFWPYHDLLFDNPDALEETDLARYAGEVELDLEAFAECRASDRPRLAVERHEEDGRRYGVEGTPAIFVNGIKLIGLLPLPVMQALIDGELAAN